MVFVNTSVLILGASSFPNCSLSGTVCFTNSANEIAGYFTSPEGLGLPKDQMLNLFDEDIKLGDLLRKIKKFITDKDRKTKDLIIYYVGHGGFGDDLTDFYLATRSTDENAAFSTSIPFADLAKILKENTTDMRCYIILDCCFAAAAVSSLQSIGLIDSVRAQTESEVDEGTAILCAASKYAPASFDESIGLTRFTHSLLSVLKTGDATEKGFMSFRRVAELTKKVLKQNFPAGHALPEIHIPSQKHGDVSINRIFPNPAISKESFTLNKFILSTFFKDSFFLKKTPDGRLVKLYSRLFYNFLSKDSKEYFDSQGVSPDDLVEALCDQAIKSNSPFPILVSGITGTGKSLLLSLIYVRLYELLKDSNTFVPVYVDLHHYEYKIYVSSNISNEAQSLLTDHLSKITSFDEVRQRDIILILDGAGENIKPKFDLVREIERQERFSKKIIGLRKSRPDVHKGNFDIHGTPEIQITLNPLGFDEHSQETLETIETFADIYANHDSGPAAKKIASHLLRILKQFNFYEFDIFSLRLLLDGLKNTVAYSKARNFSQFLRIYCNEKLNKETTIKTATKMAFDSFNLRKDLPAEDINNPAWFLIHSHQSIRNFLIAQHVIDMISSHGENQVTTDYNFVYPHEVNSHIKQLFSHNQELQWTLFNGIVKLWPKIDHSKQISTLTHFSYLLGRFTDSNVKEASRDFLNEVKNGPHLNQITSSFKNYKAKAAKDNSLKKHQRQELLYFRTIYISLIYLGDSDASDQYIDYCLSHPFQENLNRGFHLEYYGDLPYQPGDSENLLNDDSELADFNITFSKLTSKISDALDLYDKSSQPYYSMFNIEIFTICSLAQNRFIRKDNRLNSQFKLEIRNLLKRIIEQQQISNESQLMSYLLFVNKFVCEVDRMDAGSIYNLIYYIKTRERRGWVLRGGLHAQNVERVSSHIFGAEDIAFRFLPDTLDDKTYDKYVIIKMIHYHDQAEAFTADLAKGEKHANDIAEEHEWNRILSNLGMVEGFANQSDTRALLKEFSDKNTINAQYANDCDKLDCLLQLNNYRIRKKIPESVFIDFKDNLSNQILTEWGKKLRLIFLNVDKNQLNLELSLFKKYDPDLY